MKPDQQDVFFQLIVSGGGEFIYDANGNLREAGVGATTTDPVQGLTCPAGRSFWNAQGAILLLVSDSNDAIFQYFDNGSAVQGGLVAAQATASGIDPVTGHSYEAGANNINPVFGNFSIVSASQVKLAAATFTQAGTIDVQQGSGAVSPAIVLWAPEQGQSGHLVMVMQGTSPDGTHPGQLLIAALATGLGVPSPQTTGMIEIQGRSGNPADSIIELINQAVGDNGLGFRVNNDTNRRLRINAGGLLAWGPGNAVQDTNLYRGAASQLKTDDAFNCIAGTAANPTVITTDTWHSLGTLAGYTVNVGRYRLTPDNEVELDIDVSAGGANGAAVNFANALPAQYRPLADRRVAMGTNRAVTAGDPWPRVLVTAATGNVQVNQAANNTANLSSNVRIPLD